MSNYDISHSLPCWLDNRAAGVLLHPSSLPGCQGIGSLGKEARRFIDFLESAGFSYWQTCPVGPTGFGDSPYQVFCSNAGNPYFIDWSPLVASHQDLTSLVEAIANQFEALNLFELADVSETDAMAKHELHPLYPSFTSFVEVALHVYGDNVGFDHALDAQRLTSVKGFLQEILRG